MPSHPYRRLHVNPALREAVAKDGRAGWRLASLAGLHHATFSWLINTVSVPDRAKNVERLQRIANIVGFPVAEIFTSEPHPRETFDTMPLPPAEAR